MWKKIVLVILALLLVFLNHQTSFAQVDVSGFFDVQYAKPSDQQDVFSGFQYGQFEIDLSARANRRITMEGALALNQNEQKFEPGFGYLQLDLSPRARERGARSSGGYLREFGVQLGQFNVPFGLDYQVIPSIDRSLVHAPLMNRRTIDSWNSIGVNAYARSEQWSLVGFVVNGLTGGYTAGGRIGLKPGPNMELGFSYARGMTLRDGLQTTEVVGADIRGVARQFTWKGEALFSRGLLNGEPSADPMDAHWGFYLHGKYDILTFHRLPLFLVGRYGRWMPMDGFKDRLNLSPEQDLTIGLGANVAYQSQIRLEYQANFQDPGALTFQFVVGF